MADIYIGKSASGALLYMDEQYTVKGSDDNKTPAVNWPLVIESLARGNPDLYSQAVLAAQSWVTCACGVHCKRLPRTADNCPLDTVLADWGGSFYLAIMQRNYGAARRCLYKIEERSAALLAAL